MIEPYIEMIVAVPQSRRRDEVSKRYVAIGSRVQRRDCFAYGVDEQIGDLVSRKGLLRERIDRRAEQTLRKVTTPFRKSRHIGDASDSLADSRAFVVDKEECSVLDYRTAQRKAKLVALILRRFLISPVQ